MLGLLNRINHGYQQLEPTVVGLMALNHSFMLIGRHGTGKTRLARALSKGYGERGFVFYDATKDDLITIAGIPDPDGVKDGTLRFIAHQRAIWDKSTIVVDEITRAGKESQNLWLEILEERTCFGLPLAYRALVATANPESYAAAFRLDEALLDRFHAVLPVPELQAGVDPDDVQSMIRLAAQPESLLQPEEVARAFGQVRQAHAELLQAGADERVSQYLGQLVPQLLRVLGEQEATYLSPRTYARNLPQTIMAAAAYYKAAGMAEPLLRGAVDALRYGVATKLQVKPVILEQVHQAAAGLLRGGELAAAEQLKLELGALEGFDERLQFLEQRWVELQAALKADELEKVLGALLSGASQRGEREKLVVLKETLDRLGYEGDALRQVDGRLLITLNQAIQQVLPRLARLEGHLMHAPLGSQAAVNIERFRQLVSGGSFLAMRDPAALLLKQYLIDLHEGEEPGDDSSLVEFFANLELQA